MKNWFLTVMLGVSLFAFSSLAKADSFSGMYVGVGVGYQSYDLEIDVDPINIDGLSASGLAGEIAFGWGGKSGKTVYAIEVFADFADAEFEASISGLGSLTLEPDYSYGASVKVGWAPSSSTAIYAKGTILQTKFELDISGIGDDDETLTGYGLGIGIETKVGKSTSVGLEWTHVWYDEWDDPFGVPVDIEPERDTITLRLIFGF